MEGSTVEDVSTTVTLVQQPQQVQQMNVDGITTLTEFASYDDYLDRQITAIDMFYLEDIELARQLVELGYRGNNEILSR